MSYLKVNINDEGDKEFVEQLLQKLGYEVTEEPDPKTPSKKSSPISPTLLFGEWKDTDIDPTNYRKQLWERRK